MQITFTIASLLCFAAMSATQHSLSATAVLAFCGLYNAALAYG